MYKTGKYWDKIPISTCAGLLPSTVGKVIHWDDHLSIKTMTATFSNLWPCQGTLCTCCKPPPLEQLSIEMLTYSSLLDWVTKHRGNVFCWNHPIPKMKFQSESSHGYSNIHPQSGIYWWRICSIYIYVYGCFQNLGTPQIIHFKRVFHYKPSILGYPNFWKHPYIYIARERERDIFQRISRIAFNPVHQQRIKHTVTQYIYALYLFLGFGLKPLEFHPPKHFPWRLNLKG